MIGWTNVAPAQVPGSEYTIVILAQADYDNLLIKDSETYYFIMG